MKWPKMDMLSDCWPYRPGPSPSYFQKSFTTLHSMHNIQDIHTDAPELLFRKSSHFLVVYISVSGLGFGLMSGLFAMVNVLADITGPGTIGLYGDYKDFLAVTGMSVSTHSKSYLYILILCTKLDIQLGSHVYHKILVPRFVMSQEPNYRTLSYSYTVICSL